MNSDPDDVFARSACVPRKRWMCYLRSKSVPKQLNEACVRSLVPVEQKVQSWPHFAPPARG